MRSSSPLPYLAIAIATIVAAPVLAQGIEPYRAHDVQPHPSAPATPPKPAPQPSKTTPSQPASKKETPATLPPPRPAAPAQQKPSAPDATGNHVEPLSNGLRLSWTSREIKKTFGAGVPSWDSRTITYPSFRVAVGGAEEKIWHLHLTGSDVSLNSGIRPGSTRAEVQRAFGNADKTTYDQYELTFQYDGDKLIDIGIRPAAGEFTPFAERTPAASEAKTAKTPAASILGTWWGVQSMTQIDIKADGTYASPNGGKGTWRMTGDEIVFTGALAGWNNGRAKLTKGGWIEFLWKDQSGAAYLFQLVRR